MTSKRSTFIILSNTMAATLLASGLVMVVLGGAAPSTQKVAIYNEKADSRAEIAAAVHQAKVDNKLVLITWGGNWCGWCHLLHGTFEDNAEINAYLNKHYVRLLVDTRSNKDLMKELEVVPRGVPYLTVLDADGKKLIDQETDVLEKGGAHDPEKVLAFLKKYEPVPVLFSKTAPDSEAEKRLKSAVAGLDRDDKRLLVKFSTQSCGWCRRLDDFLADDAIAPILGKDFVAFEVDQGELEGAKELRERLAANNPSGGVPWYAILDKKGKVLTTATGPEGNIGYPAEPEGIVHFMKMIRGSATTLDEEDFAVVEGKLKEIAKKYGY